MSELADGFLANMYLQLRRFWRARARVVGSVLQPIFWMVFFGIGLTNFAALKGARMEYIDYLIPGVIVMTVFTSSFFSGMSVIIDREFGFLKVVLVSPASRKGSMLGRIFGDSLIALVQGAVIGAVAYLLDPRLNYASLPAVLLISLAVGLSTSAIGVAIASRIGSVEGFGLIMNLIVTPFMFASGVFFPIEALPPWLRILSYVSPLTYGADASRELMAGHSSMGVAIDLLALGVILLASLALAFESFERMTVQ